RPCKHLSLQGYCRKVLARQSRFIPRLCLHVHHANPPVLIDLPAEPGPGNNLRIQSDPPRKERTQGTIAKVVKLVTVFDEKLPRFREKEFIAAQIGYLPVYFHL